MENNPGWVRIELDQDDGKIWEVRHLSDPKVRIHYEIHGDGATATWTIRKIWLPNPSSPEGRPRGYLIRQAHRFLESLLTLESQP